MIGILLGKVARRLPTNLHSHLFLMIHRDVTFAGLFCFYRVRSSSRIFGAIYGAGTVASPLTLHDFCKNIFFFFRCILVLVFICSRLGWHSVGFLEGSSLG